jgi:dTDP-4-dehydrorhamnose reductase
MSKKINILSPEQAEIAEELSRIIVYESTDAVFEGINSKIDQQAHLASG